MITTLPTLDTVYKDDFHTHNVEDKNYLRILFNGGRAVQVRELNQLQSVLQSQIDKFGSSIYKQGTAVIGGGCSFDRKITKINFLTSILAIGLDPSQVQTLSQGSGISADVIGYEVVDDTTSFFIRYSVGSGATLSDGKFDLVDAITMSGIGENAADSKLAASSEIVAGIFLAEGVFFVNGSFVVTPQQSKFVEITDLVNGISGSAVLTVTEDIVTYTDDATLLDNSIGSPNHLAPGADRYRITLTLDFLEDGAVADTINRITLLSIVNSNIIFNSKVKYSDLDRQLAQRTYEESGDYIINPFRIDIKDLLGSGRPGATDLDASDRVYIGLDPSVAYVDGYRIELGQKLDLTAPRARTFAEKDVTISLGFGNYVDVSLAIGGSSIPLPNTANLVYDLFDATTPIPLNIGSCRIKAIESVGANFRLFLYDIALEPNVNLSDVATVTNTTASVDLVVEAPISDTANDTALFKFPYTNVKSISNAGDFSYVKKAIFVDVVDPAGQFTITTGTGETFEDSSISNFVVEVNDEWISTFQTVPPTSSSSITLESSTITPWTPGDTIKVIFPVKVTTAANTQTKSLLTITDEVILLPEVGTSDYVLANTDIFDILTVKENGSSDVITSDFTISFDGQTQSHYTNAKIRYNGAGAAPAIKVTYRYFSHNSLPFTINSYPIDWDENSVLAANKIRYANVPVFGEYNLGDCVDFRPTILAGSGTLSVIQADPNSSLSAKATFFLPRLDKVIVNSNGEFKIVPGVPAPIATSPLTPPASMALYELDFPAYTFSAADVIINYVDNRRYTMRDIAALDKRINTLEYYTSLSLLEKSANEKTIVDNVGASRFKNGILVDGFNGHGIGDVFNSAYACSIDKLANTLRPKFGTKAVDLVYNAGTSSGVRVHENIVTLDYDNLDDLPIVSQLVSSESESVNPYDVATFVGSVKLFPTNDKWMETNRRPDVINNNDGVNDALAFLAEESGIVGTEWNTWQTNWTGVVNRFNTVRRPPSRIPGRLRSMTKARVTVTETQQSRTGVVTTVSNKTVTENLGDRVVDISFIPFIRSRKVYFKAVGLKPLTRVYPFFDGIAIDSYVHSEAAIVNAVDQTDVTEYFNKLPGDITSTTLISDDRGELIGSFIIPNNSALQFRTGERKFRISDSATSNLTEETCFAEATYNASGMIQTVEGVILSTRVPEIRRERVEDTRVLQDETIRWMDPLAQTFIINDVAEGVFVTSLDLWFSSKSATIPVTVRIVAVENGYPSQRVVPFSEVTKRAEDVTLWVNPGDDPTTFVFSDPVYLKGGVEYAFVVLSNDPEYRIRVARLGGTGEDGKIIQQNPYGGVMFMSQNASTWTADQTRDIKFQLKRAVFVPANTGLATFKSMMNSGVESLSVDPLDTSANYTTVTVTIAPPTTGTNQATADAIIDLISGKITGYTMTNNGSGYTSVPAVTFVGDGTGAKAIANLYSAKASAFTIMQGSVFQREAEILNEFTAGVTTYSNVEAAETYSPVSEFTVTRANQVALETTLATSSEYITPVIDLDTMTLLCIENKVNTIATNDTTEVINDGGDALSRYISREVILNDPADQLNIYLDVNRPTNTTDIKVYVKLKYDSSTYSDWLAVSPNVPIAINDDTNEYSEAAYSYSSLTNDFVSFSVKIVFISSSTVNTASVKNLRIIATA